MESISLQQALVVSKSFQYLTGREFDKTDIDISPVLCVTACPADPGLQKKFIRDYCDRCTTDLTGYVEEEEFAVVVIARRLSDCRICVWLEVADFIEKYQFRQAA